MARSRNIKPDFFLDEDLCDLPMAARILFAGLWCLADKAGRLKDSPRRIKVQILPYDDCDIDDLLNKLSTHFITRYEVDGENYIQINRFEKHQRPHHTEAESILPPIQSNTVKQPTTKNGNKNNTITSTQLDNGEVTVKEPSNNGYTPPDSLNTDSLNTDSLLTAPSDKNHSPPPPPPDMEPVFISITLNDKTEFPIYETQVHEWGSLFPSVDVKQELRNIYAWNKANPTRRKTKRGILNHITAWLAKEQNRGGNKRATSQPTDQSGHGDIASIEEHYRRGNLSDEEWNSLYGSESR